MLLITLSHLFTSVIVGDDPEDMRLLSDINLLAWFLQHVTNRYFCIIKLSLTIVMQAESSPTLSAVLTEFLPALGIGSRIVISSASTNTVLDAMKLMSEQGVSSVAVVDNETGDLLSAISVTDIARVSNEHLLVKTSTTLSLLSQLVAPSQSNKILSMPLGQFVALVKVRQSSIPFSRINIYLICTSLPQAPDGSQDGVDRYPGNITIMFAFLIFNLSINNSIQYLYFFNSLTCHPKNVGKYVARHLIPHHPNLLNFC